MQDDLKGLTNIAFKVLNVIYDNQVTVNGETYCPLSQSELADLVGISRSNLNIQLDKLKELKLVDDSRQLKRVILTDRAIEIIQKVDVI